MTFVMYDGFACEIKDESSHFVKKKDNQVFGYLIWESSYIYGPILWNNMWVKGGRCPQRNLEENWLEVSEN